MKAKLLLTLWSTTLFGPAAMAVPTRDAFPELPPMLQEAAMAIGYERLMAGAAEAYAAHGSGDLDARWDDILSRHQLVELQNIPNLRCLREPGSGVHHCLNPIALRQKVVPDFCLKTDEAVKARRINRFTVTLLHPAVPFSLIQSQVLTAGQIQGTSSLLSNPRP